MKPTTGEVLAWAREAGYTKVDPTRDPMSILERFATLAYAAGAKAMKERAAKVCEDFDDSDYAAGDSPMPCEYAEAIRAVGDADE